jgi:hypothetical protein
LLLLSRALFSLTSSETVRSMIFIVCIAWSTLEALSTLEACSCSSESPSPSSSTVELSSSSSSLLDTWKGEKNESSE